MQTDFSRAQQAVETVLGEYDDLREQGFTRPDAIDHVRLKYGVERRKIVALLNDREFRAVHVAPLETPDVPDTFPAEWA